MTANQMKYLLALIYQPAGRQNQSDVAKIFGVNKSTVSRAVLEAVKQGLLSDTGTAYELTGYGKEYIQTYEYRLNRISEWLCSQGVGREKAREDSFAILGNCSAETLAVLQEKGKIASIYQNLNRLENKQEIEGKVIARYIEEGEYPVGFVFYRKETGFEIQGENHIDPVHASMANEAFYHPAVLRISRAGNHICLRTRSMMQKSGKNHQVMDGRLKTMKYRVDKKEKIVMLNDETVYIPLEVMRFVYFREEQILQGYMSFSMSCTVGDIHMPESTAILMVSI